MPQAQIATMGNFDFRAPVAEAEVLRFRTKPNRSGKLTLLFENPDSANNLTVTVQVAPAGADNVTPGSWADTSAANNLAAVATVVVEKRCRREATILLRPGIDVWMRLQALGGGRGVLQIRGDDILEPVHFDTATSGTNAPIN